jgi:hypothetical protein
MRWKRYHCIQLTAMKNIFTITMLLLFTTMSCSEIDEEILPIVGTYYGKVQGLNRPFTMSVYGISEDDIQIEAPFDGDVWTAIRVDIDNPYEYKWDLDINRQTLSPGIEIWGDGYFVDGTIQLDYTISFDGDKYRYRLIASR